MKFYFLVLVVLTFCSSLSSQIRRIDSSPIEDIGNVNVMGEKLIWMVKQDDVYTITFRDGNYTQIDDYKSFSFRDIDDSFEYLYETIIQGFDDKPKDPIMLELDEDIIGLKYIKSFGKASLRISLFPNKGTEEIGYYQYLNKKKVKKLFGK